MPPTRRRTTTGYRWELLAGPSDERTHPSVQLPQTLGDRLRAEAQADNRAVSLLARPVLGEYLDRQDAAKGQRQELSLMARTATKPTPAEAISGATTPDNE
jgi:hypothetical protein